RRLAGHQRPALPLLGVAEAERARPLAKRDPPGHRRRLRGGGVHLGRAVVPLRHHALRAEAGAVRSALPLAVIAAALAALAAPAAGCARAPAAAEVLRHRKPAALWIGGDVFLGAAPEGRLGSVGALERGRAGVVNLEGPIGAVDATMSAA